jgi:hypothetical protein
MSSVTVEEALSTLKMDKELQDYLLSKRAEWEMFGKMNSHMYRSILMKYMKEANLDGKQRFMVFFLFSVVKNKDRVLKSMEMMSPEDKAKDWFGPVMAFINTKVTQYVSDVSRSKKFPAVNIPNCNPGLDVLVWCLITHPNKRTMKELSERTTFSQLHLSASVQDYAKVGYARFWDSVVRTTKNPDAVAQNLPAPAFREDYYANSKSDEYRLVDLQLRELEPVDKINGYSWDEVIEYLRFIDPNKEYDRKVALLDRELEEADEGEIV